MSQWSGAADLDKNDRLSIRLMSEKISAALARPRGAWRSRVRSRKWHIARFGGPEAGDFLFASWVAAAVAPWGDGKYGTVSRVIISDPKADNKIPTTFSERFGHAASTWIRSAGFDDISHAAFTALLDVAMAPATKAEIRWWLDMHPEDALHFEGYAGVFTGDVPI